MSVVPIPLDEPIALVTPRDRYRLAKQQDPALGRVNDKWVTYFNDQAQQASQAPMRIASVAVTSQSASIAAVDFSGGSVAAGYYRVTYYARITRAATSSSSLTVTLDWTDGSVSPNYSGAAMTGNTTSTIQSGTLLILVDQNSPIRYSTTYASSGATTMQYALHVILEKVNV